MLSKFVELKNIQAISKLAWPMVIGMLSYTVMDITDTLLVGWLGKTELAGVGAGTTVAFFITSFFIGLFESIKILVAQATGAEQDTLASEGGWQGIFIAFPIGISICFLTFFSVPIFDLFGGPEPVQAIARDYFEIRLLASPLWFVMLAMVCYYQGFGDTKTPMLINLMVCALNVVLDILLIDGPDFFPKLGVAGAAYATVISTAVGMLVLFVLFIKRVGFKPRFNPILTKKLLNIGWPVGVRFALDTGGWTLMTAFIARIGETELAANQIASKLFCVCVLPIYGISEAGCVLVGQRVGSKKLNEVSQAYRAALFLVVCVVAFFSVLFTSFPEYLISFFQDDPDVIGAARPILIMVSIFMFVEAFTHATSGALNGTGDTKFTMYAAILTTWLVSVPSAFVLGVQWQYNATGVWLGLALGVAIFALSLHMRFKSGIWRTKAVIGE